jgi:hypothetical protein
MLGRPTLRRRALSILGRLVAVFDRLGSYRSAVAFAKAARAGFGVLAETNLIAVKELKEIYAETNSGSLILWDA